MISISGLYCGCAESSDELRYGRGGRAAAAGPTARRECRPVVVWNATRRCNLRCVHCYSASTTSSAENELTTREARDVIDDLAGFGAPVILFSGGEPLMREDLPELIARAAGAGLRTVLSSNGTLVTARLAGELARAGLDYAGISLDGLAQTNDRIRAERGAFAKALAGLARCAEAGIKVGLRLTMTRQNVDQLPGIFDLLAREGIPRACFYHLVPAGRAEALAKDALDKQQTRRALDVLIDRTAAAHAAARSVEVLTVDNHADGAYLYLKLRKTDPARAEEALRLLRMQGGNSSGCRIGCISWNGDVHPDQFWRRHVLGNVRRRPFSSIWADDGHPLLAKLRSRDEHLKGRCSRCRWLDICNGNLRARAEAAARNLWADDPACYLTDEEIAP